MDEVPDARELSDGTIAEMVRRVDPDLTLERANQTERGFCTVYRVEAERAGATRPLYLKASPDGQAWAIPTEARIQAVLQANTSIPVPEILGVVDENKSLPTPFYLMSALPGDELDYERVAYLGDDKLTLLASDVGRCLGDLHSVQAVEQFGHVRHDDTELTGERPSGDPAALTVGESRADWPTYLREYAGSELDRHEDSQFRTLTPELRQQLEDGIEALAGPFEPVLGRNDHGLHNLLVDPATGEVTAMLDWGYTLAVPPAFDFEFAVYLFSGAFLAGLDDVRDRRPLVREAMLGGYRETAPDRVAAVEPRESLYELLAMVRIMNDFHHLDIPEGAAPAVRERIHADAAALLEG